MAVEFSTSGPLFDGRLERAIEGAYRDGLEQVAEVGAQLVRSTLDASLRHQTGWYRSHVIADGNTVTDQGVIYGPWLEGVGSRNRTTRFKGYASFRRARQQLDAQAGTIVRREIVRRMVGVGA